jgi:hypothetical protein
MGSECLCIDFMRLLMPAAYKSICSNDHRAQDGKCYQHFLVKYTVSASAEAIILLISGGYIFYSVHFHKKRETKKISFFFLLIRREN